TSRRPTSTCTTPGRAASPCGSPATAADRHLPESLSLGSATTPGGFMTTITCQHCACRAPAPRTMCPACRRRMRPAETVIPAAPSVPEQPVPAVAARAATTVLPTAQPRRRPAIPAVLVGVFRLPPRRVERAVAVLDERV